MENSRATRLVIFIHSMGGGGAERVAANLANYWAQKGWEITVVTLASQSVDFYTLHPAVKRIALNLASESRSLGTALWQNVRRVIALRQTLRQIRPDVALGMMTTANVLLALAVFGLGIPAIGSERIHPPQAPLSPLWERLRRQTYGRLQAVAVLTRETGQWLKEHTNATRIAVIPNPIPWPLPAHEPIVKPDSVCRPGRKVLLAVGRLEVQKGFDWLIDAFSALATKYPEWDLVILGEGSLRATLEKQVQTSGLARRVFLPGRVGNVGDWYERANLYVMSSRFEGFPNSLGEAMAYGLPAVSFDCETGPRDIIRHETDGLLVPAGDTQGLVATLDRLMGDAALRRRLATRAVEARERFALEKIASRWEALFEACMRDS